MSFLVLISIKNKRKNQIKQFSLYSRNNHSPILNRYEIEHFPYHILPLCFTAYRAKLITFSTSFIRLFFLFCTSLKSQSNTSFLAGHIHCIPFLGIELTMILKVVVAVIWGGYKYHHCCWQHRIQLWSLLFGRSRLDGVR